jgi:hypothetical protein
VGSQSLVDSKAQSIQVGATSVRKKMDMCFEDRYSRMCVGSVLADMLEVLDIGSRLQRAQCMKSLM